MLMQLLCHPRAIPLADICYQDGVFIVRLLDTNTGVICLTPDTAANKIDGVTKITFDEAVAIRDKFFPGIGLEYLYQNE